MISGPLPSGYMATRDVDVLEVLQTVPQLADAQLWEIAARCRAYRARTSDGEDQTVEIEMSVDTSFGLSGSRVRPVTTPT